MYEIKWRKYLFHSSANGICTPALRFLIDECRIIKFFSGYIVNLVKPDMKLVDMCCMQSKPGRKHFEHCHWQTRVKYKNCCSSNRCSSDRLQNVKRKGLTLLPFSVSTSFESGRLSSPSERLPIGDAAMCAAAGLHRSCIICRCGDILTRGCL